MAHKSSRNRSIHQIVLVTLAIVALLIADVFFVAIGQIHLRSGTDLSAYADNANINTSVIKALRGNIYDRVGGVIAQDNRTYNIVCVLADYRPAVEGQIAYVKDKEGTAEILSSILGMDKNQILEYFSRDVYQTELGEAGRKLPKAVKDEIESFNLPGIEFTDSIQRVYPMGQFASNLIGYAQSDETGSTVGQMGLELYLDSYLAGKDGSHSYQVDKNGYILPGMKETIVSAQNGYNVNLTIDPGIQSTLEESFKTTRRRFYAYSVWGGAMEIATGKVIAWGQAPSFDPNTLDNITEYQNIGAQTPYEPGSTLKPFTWAAAMNEGVYDGNMTTDGNQFCFVGDAYNNPVRTYSDDNYGCIFNANGVQWGAIDLDHGLIYSLNTVAATIQNELINPDTHLEYLKKFGFFKPVDTDGLPESSGTLNFAYAYDKVALSFGQGTSVTMLQLFQAYSAIFGDGRTVRPYFVESIRDPYDNSVIYQAETKYTGEPISAETAKQVQQLMYRVVNDSDGTAKYYQIPECKVIGKTGTGEVAVNGQYQADRYITSVILALPADNPQVLVYYAFDSPADKYSHYETEAVTAVARKVAMTYGFNDSGSQARPETVIEDIEEYTMPSLVNHSTDYSLARLEGMNTETHILGEGSNVIDQFPKAESTVVSGQRVFLLTDTNSFILPDMTGWTRKDVAGLWAVTGFGFTLSGEGTVVSQDIPPGTIVTKGTEILVEFST